MMRTLAIAISSVAACGTSGGSKDPDARTTADATADATPDATPDAAPDAVPDAAPDAMFDNGTTQVTMTKQGNPLWETVGWQAFSARTDLATAELIWAHHTWDASHNSFVPGPAHAPPYSQEIDDAVAANHWDPGDDFYASAWTVPAGLVFAGAIVPSTGAPTGKTPDAASGPMIPDSIQIVIDADMLKSGTVVDPDFDSTYPTLATLVPSGGYAGWSHMPLTFGEDTSFIPGTPGDYTMRVHLSEAATPANGWVIEIPFTIR